MSLKRTAVAAVSVVAVAIAVLTGWNSSWGRATRGVVIVRVVNASGEPIDCAVLAVHTSSGDVEQTIGKMNLGASVDLPVRDSDVIAERLSWNARGKQHGTSLTILGCPGEKLVLTIGPDGDASAAHGP